MGPGDAQLVRSVLGGDRSAYAVLYDRYARWVRAVCYDTTHDFSESQDLAQDIFLRAYARLGELREPERFGAWLHTIARNRCLEWMRAHLRRSCESLPADFEIAAGGEGDSGEGERIEDLREALLALPERERLAIHSHYLLNHSADEAGSIFNLSRAGWYRLLGRARKHLERLVKRKARDMR